MERAISTTAAVEEWRPIAGYEGLYEVSSLGQVRSVDRYIDAIDKYGKTLHLFFSSKVIKQTRMSNGYVKVHLYKDSREKQYLVHRLVAQAFIPNPDNLPEVNHKDEDQANNTMENLEWCDRIYNMNYGTCIKRRALKQSKVIEQLTMDGQHVAYYLGIKPLCRNTNMCRHIIQHCIHGNKRHKTAYGYRWRYADVSKDEVQLATDYSLVKYQKKDTTHT